MKRLALVAAVLVIAACTTKDEKMSDTSAPAMTPMPMDSMAMKDSMMKDSMMMMKKDSAMMKKP